MKKNTKTHLFLIPLFFLIGQTQRVNASESEPKQLNLRVLYAIGEGEVEHDGQTIKKTMYNLRSRMEEGTSPELRRYAIPTFQAFTEECTATGSHYSFIMVGGQKRISSNSHGLHMFKLESEGTPLTPYSQTLEARFPGHVEGNITPNSFNGTVSISADPTSRILSELPDESKRERLDHLIKNDYGNAIPTFIPPEDDTKISLSCLHANVAANAAANGDMENLKLIMLFGWEVNSQNRLGQLAMVTATRFGQPGVVSFLMENRGDPTLAEFASGLCAREVAEREGHHEIAEIIEQGMRPSPPQTVLFLLGFKHEDIEPSTVVIEEIIEEEAEEEAERRD
ncbi:hypothetical protein ACFLX2_01090 [Candidatus Dependentiae bacterium]